MGKGNAEIVQGDERAYLRPEEGQAAGGADEGDAGERKLEGFHLQGVQL